MERPIIIFLKDDGKITKEQMAQCKEMLEEAVKKAYEQGYEDGKKSVWTVTSPDAYPLPTNGMTFVSLDSAPMYLG